MSYQYNKATIIDIIDETETVKRFIIKVPEDQGFRFKAGQFIMVDLPIDHKYTNRAYSIASAPNEDSWFELCIVLNPNGKGTPYMWENYKIGDEVMVSTRALGKFGLPQVIDRDICFICTGTGIAPLRSMLVDILQKGIPHKNLYMIFGTRYEKDILYRNEMEELQKKHPEFNFIPVLSRDEWEGEHGYVHQVYQKLFEDKRPAYFYICGWKDMLNQSRQTISEMGYSKDCVKFESYD